MCLLDVFLSLDGNARDGLMQLMGANRITHDRMDMRSDSEVMREISDLVQLDGNSRW